jgi:N-alpha-acetyltransferase 15/16, NatA auxiliary subunit
MYNTLMHLYDKKEYDKAHKTAEAILCKFPNHGETLAMFGLVTHTLGRKDEGYVSLKLGLRNDIRSATCWHVLGLANRADDNYKEASKCFLNAVRIDPNNQNIWRDLSFLQIQLRDIAGFRESRRKSIVLRPALRANWLGFIAASYLAGDFSATYELIDQLKEAWRAEMKDNYEESELMLFQQRCLERQGRHSEALEYLDKHGPFIVDTLSVKVKRAELYLRTFQWEKARAAWKPLLDEQCSNYRYHCGFQLAVLQIEDAELIDRMLKLTRLDVPSSVLTLSEEQRAALRAEYLLAADGTGDAAFCGNTTTKRVAMTLFEASDPAFRAQLDAYLRKRITANVPSLYSDIVSLVTVRGAGGRQLFVVDQATFKAHPVVQLTMELTAGYISNLKQHGTFDGAAATASDSPSSLLWAMFLRCHLCELSGDLAQALSLINECIVHTPTACDMYMKKARVLKKTGDLKAASEVADFGRSLDLQDRFLNNKATKYLLRADQVLPAMDTVAMFTKHDGDPQKILSDLQVAWYELELGECAERLGVLGLALKKFCSVQKHFYEYHGDMFDFHQYCLRKGALRTYTEMLVMMDGMHAHKTYQRAARGALRVYLRLAAGEQSQTICLDDPPPPLQEIEVDAEAQPEAESKEEDGAQLSAAAKKKKRKKKNKVDAAAKAANEEEEETKKVEKDEDPLGLACLELPVSPTVDTCAAALSVASKWCANLSKMQGIDADTQALVCTVYVMRQKYVLAARAVAMGWAQQREGPAGYFCPVHPDLLVAATRLALALQSPPAPIPDVVRAAAEEQLGAVLGGQDIGAFLQAAAAACSASQGLDYRVGLAKAMALCAQSGAVELVVADRYCDWTTTTCKSCVKALKVGVKPCLCPFLMPICSHSSLLFLLSVGAELFHWRGRRFRRLLHAEVSREVPPLHRVRWCERAADASGRGHRHHPREHLRRRQSIE